MSVHAYARQILLDALEDRERGALLESVTELQEMLKQHREEFRRATLALLVYAGEQEEEDARAWVEENLTEE